ncbi:MAG: DegT/DnrJ/EryC1/StrS family aminotransferase [Candidatus Caldarchaeales archaeon]
MEIPKIIGGEPVRNKPYPSWPIFSEKEKELLISVLESGVWGVGGKLQEEFERRFAEFQDSLYAVLCSSGTTALKIALKAMGIKPGDEVIIPAYTFIGTATAALDLNARIIYADIDLNTYTIDVESVRDKVTEKTKAIIPVHFAGRPSDMDAVKEFSEEHGLLVLEDAAQSHGAEWRNKKVGAIGDAGAFSFQSSKNITAGEGGAITTNDDEIASTAWSLRNVGRPRDGPWYEHRIYGWNYRITEWQAAVLLAQLDRAPKLMEKRDASAKYLEKELREVDGIEPLPNDKKVTRHAHHIFVLKYNPDEFNGLSKELFVEALRAEGIPCNAGYRPLYSYSFLPSSRPLENTERASYIEAVWLPQTVLLGEVQDLEDILRAILKIKRYSKEIVEKRASRNRQSTTLKQNLSREQ